MKFNKHFLYIAATVCAMASLSACSDSDDEPAIVSKADELKSAVETMRVKIGPENMEAVPITSGGGDYRGFSLSPDVCDIVKGDDGNLYVQGFSNGTAHVVISDCASQYITIPVQVYTTDVLTLENPSYELVTPLGYSGSGRTRVLLGNGNYSIVSHNKAVKASIDSEGVITLTATSAADPFEAKATVKDGSGLEAELTITVVSTLDPFTDVDKEELCAIDTQSKLYISDDDYEPYYWNGYRENFITEVNDGQETFGHIRKRNSRDRYWLTITYPEGQALNTPFKAQLSYGYNYNNNFSTEVTAEILKDDEISKVAIYSWIDPKTGKLERGYFVHVLADDGY